MRTYFLALQTNIAGAATYIPRFNNNTPIPYPITSDSDSACDIIDSDDNNGVIPLFTAYLNAGFSLSISAIVGENKQYNWLNSVINDEPELVFIN